MDKNGLKTTSQETDNEADHRRADLRNRSITVGQAQKENSYGFSKNRRDSASCGGKELTVGSADPEEGT